LGGLPLFAAVQDNVLDVCSSVVFSTNFPCQQGCAPDLPLLSVLDSCLGLPVMHQGVVLVLHAPFADTSKGAVFRSYCIDCVYVPFSAQSNLENTTLFVRKLFSKLTQFMTICKRN
jgi:hypothetical protein